MTGPDSMRNDSHPDLFEAEATRSLLDRLLTDSRPYTKTQDFKKLLDFVARMRNLAPFNAMLLQVQKPGLHFAASAFDWEVRFGRKPKEGAHPLLTLWPFGPVAVVYDVLDTEGAELPRGFFSCYARGPVDEGRIAAFAEPPRKKNIDWCWVDAGDERAGFIRVTKRATSDNEATECRIHINRNHPPATQFKTVAHELAHLFFGHLGPHKKLNIPERPRPDHRQGELEAESVAYLVCARKGIESASETYLTDYVDQHITVDQIDVYQVMPAAGHVEALLGLSEHTRFESRNRQIVGGKLLQRGQWFIEG